MPFEAFLLFQCGGIARRIGFAFLEFKAGISTVYIESPTQVLNVAIAMPIGQQLRIKEQNECEHCNYSDCSFLAVLS